MRVLIQKQPENKGKGKIDCEHRGRPLVRDKKTAAI
jgi:hypothetical protein